MRNYLLALFLIVFCMSAQAQSKSRFGMRAGLNITDIAEIDSEERYDFYTGAYLAIKFTEQYTLQFELNYSRQGAKLNGFNSLNIDEVRIDYLSVSILNKIYLVKRLHIVFGQYLDVNVYDNLIHSNDYFFWPYLDLGFIVGLGIDVVENLSLEARYRHGLIDVYNVNSETQPHVSNIGGRNTNKVFQLGLAYKFDF